MRDIKDFVIRLPPDVTDDDLEKYDLHDQAWMKKMGKHPPTAVQLAIAFGKYASGTVPGDEMWCQYDQDALDYSLLHSKSA